MWTRDEHWIGLMRNILTRPRPGTCYTNISHMSNPIISYSTCILHIILIFIIHACCRMICINATWCVNNFVSGSYCANGSPFNPVDFYRARTKAHFIILYTRTRTKTRSIAIHFQRVFPCIYILYVWIKGFRRERVKRTRINSVPRHHHRTRTYTRAHE